MNNKILWISIAIAAMALACQASAAAPFSTSTYSEFTNWWPVIVAAALVSCCLAGGYYMAGAVLNNARIRASALAEFEQALGSIALVAMVVFVLYMVGTSEISFSTLLGSKGTSDVWNICNTYLNYGTNLVNSGGVPFLPSSLGGAGGYGVALLDSNYYDPNSNPPGLPEPTTAVCQSIIGAPVDNTNQLTSLSSGPITSHIDYGLAATYVIVANMTNQSIGELNAIYNLEGIIFFLRQVKPYIGFCIPAEECDVAVLPDEGIEMKLSYQPYFGYILHRSVMPVVTTQATLTTYMLVMQLTVILLVLNFWPYLLAGGLILRTLPFTRRTGGLLLAGTIAFLLILPTIYLIEYSTMNNITPQSYTQYCSSTGQPLSSCNMPPGTDTFVGANQIPGIALCGWGTIPGSDGNNVLYCYTSADQLKVSYIYKGIQPSSYTPPPTYYNPSPSSEPFPTTMSACPSGPAGWAEAELTSSSDPFSEPPACYVKRDLSFYSFPQASQVIGFYTCYPGGNNIIFPTETEIVASTVITGASLPITAVMSLFSTSFNILSNPVAELLFNSPNGCIEKLGPHNIAAAIGGLVDIYGIMTVSAFLIPILNTLILLSAITGISSVIGGETNIVGLSRFI